MTWEKVLLLGLAVFAIGAISVWGAGIFDEADEGVAFGQSKVETFQTNINNSIWGGNGG